MRVGRMWVGCDWAHQVTSFSTSFFCIWPPSRPILRHSEAKLINSDSTISLDSLRSNFFMQRSRSRGLRKVRRDTVASEQLEFDGSILTKCAPLCGKEADPCKFRCTSLPLSGSVLLYLNQIKFQSEFHDGSISERAATRLSFTPEAERHDMAVGY